SFHTNVGCREPGYNLWTIGRSCDRSSQGSLPRKTEGRRIARHESSREALEIFQLVALHLNLQCRILANHSVHVHRGLRSPDITVGNRELLFRSTVQGMHNSVEWSRGPPMCRLDARID